MSKSTRVTNELEDSNVPANQDEILTPTEPKERHVKVQFDIKYKGDSGKVMDPSTETMPDMSITVRQLLENHSRGIDSNVNIEQPLYFDTEIPVLNDITDVEAYKASLTERLASVEEYIQTEKKEAQNASKEAVEATQDAESEKE